MPFKMLITLCLNCQRSDIVTGNYEPSEKECEWESEDEDLGEDEEETKIKEIDETKKDEVNCVTVCTSAAHK